MGNTQPTKPTRQRRNAAALLLDCDLLEQREQRLIEAALANLQRSLLATSDTLNAAGMHDEADAVRGKAIEANALASRIRCAGQIDLIASPLATGGGR